MPFQDYEEFIAALNKHGVRYLIIGAHAVAFHARPRATKDLDILVDPTPANARRIQKALRDFFGGVDTGYTMEELIDPRCIIQLGVAPIRIDLMPDVLGCPDFSAAWKKRITSRFGNIKAHYPGLDDLITMKEASRRPQDLADIRPLKRARKRRR